MAILPMPDLILNNYSELSAGELTQRKIRLLFLDVDNTIAPYSESTPTVRLRNWVDSLKKEGIEPFILSNNHGIRPKNFASALSVEYIGRAGKPSAQPLLSVLRQKGIAPEETAIIGDQIFTDILCGKRAEVFTILVKPISLRNPIYALRYILELPFRRTRGKKEN